jgi:hypothetical protein
MYCPSCRILLSINDRYCSSCGEKTQQCSEVADTIKSTEPQWRNSADFKKVLGHPDVSGTILRVAGAHRSGMSSGDFLMSSSSLLGSLGAGTATLPIIGEVVPRWADRIGIRTGKSEVRDFQFKVGEAIAAVACSLAARGMPLIDGEQASDGCVLLAKIHSSIWTWGGEITLAIEEQRDGSRIRVMTHIRGQIFDWGASKSYINDLYDDIPRYVRLLP